VLDEPSIGLHQRDNNRLLETLKRLRDLGNTVIVVEHDEDAIRTADYVIDMGPGAGMHGGKSSPKARPKRVMKNRKSLTAQYLTGRRESRRPESAARQAETSLESSKARRGNNLKNVTASKFRSARSPASPAFPAAANRR
jgi:excinuclease ABC subunit A